jgi:hypothetical protein
MCQDFMEEWWKEGEKEMGDYEDVKDGEVRGSILLGFVTISC